MEILQSYNNDTLQLISDNSDYTFTESDLQIGVVKISVFSDIGTYLDGQDLQENIDFYVKDDELFLKPNEYLDRNGFSEANYNLQFDFLKRKLANFHISQISPSRKEIRLTAPGVSIDNVIRNQISDFMNENYSGEVQDDYQFNSNLELSQGRLIPINGYAFDEVTNNKRTLIIKLNQPLPSDVATLSTDFNISNKFLSSQTETIFFIDREQLVVAGLGLDIDVSFATLDAPISDTAANYNEITASVGENIVEQVNRLQKDLNLNIDYEKFDGHVFFGSAKSKLENFKNKVVKLDGLYSQISSSLSMTSNAQVIEKRKDLFREIQDVKNEFTHYEYFMYNDGQTYSTSSAPGVGNNFAGRDYSNKGGNSLKTLPGRDGFDKVYKKEKDGFIHLFTDVYNVEDAPFYNSNDFFYLSFVLKGGGDAEGKFTLNISGGLANENYNTNSANSVSSLGNYPYSNDRQIPFDAFSGSAILNSETTGSEYRRYIFKAQQNYFRPTTQYSDKRILNLSAIYTKDSTTWQIITGSMVSELITDGTGAKLLDMTGKFANYFFPSNFDEDGLVDSNANRPTIILPQGDLFPVFTNGPAASNDQEAFFTDVVVTKNDPTNILPFSKTYRPPSESYVGSSEWNTWYNALYDIASDYDDNNIHSLVNNLPEILQTGEEHKVLRDFVNMLGEQFDLLRSYIDNYHNIYKLGYKNPNAMPDNLLPIIGNSLGFDLENPMSGSLENYLQGTGGDEVGDKKAIASLWTKILNNLMYIYKTKGTHESINTLLNLYGYDTNSFNLTEYGGSSDEHNPSVVTNDTKNDLDNGLKNVKGNVSFKEKTEQLKSLNLISGSDSLALNWWTQDAKPNGIEFILRTTPTNNTQTITRASGSEADLWDLKIIPSGSSTTTGSLEFRLNSSVNGTGSLETSTNVISMTTGYINDINNFKYFNVMLQKNVVTTSAALTQSYHMFVGRKERDKIKDIQFISTSSFDTNANKNFITASAAEYSAGNNLFFGESISGSIAEIRGWDAYVSMSKFKQHILNYKSVVGGEVTSARDSLIYHYPLSDNESSTTIKDISSPSKVNNFDKTVSSQPSLTVKSSISDVKNFSFQVRGTDAVKSDKQYKIGSDLKSVGGLNSKVATLKQPVKAGTNEPKVQVVNKIGKTYSYVDAIDSIIINSMADFEIDDYLDDYDNNGIYDDLLTLRKQLIQERLISVDIVKNLSIIENHTDNFGFGKKIEGLLPAKTKFEFSYEVKNDTLFRSKIKKASLQTELNPNKVIGSANLTEPVVSVNFNENKHEKNINVLTDEFSVSALANENLKEKTIDVLTDEVSVSATANDKVNSNSSIKLNITDLSNSSNQKIFNVEPDNFTDLLLGSKNEFYKNSGIGINNTFFKSGNPGNDGNYNTYKYEDRFFFRSIGDTEEFFPVSGTYEDRTGTNAKQPFNHHDNFRHFGNRYYVDSKEGYTYNSFFGSGSGNFDIDGRMVGRTLFFKSDTGGNITYPINHYFKVGTSKDMLTNLIYKGTQNDGSNPPQFDPELDITPTISAYTINVGGSDTTKKLKVIR
jgi:hypothetical protein